MQNYDDLHDAQPGLRMWPKKKQVKRTKKIRRQ